MFRLSPHEMFSYGIFRINVVKSVVVFTDHFTFHFDLDFLYGDYCVICIFLFV